MIDYVDILAWPVASVLIAYILFDRLEAIMWKHFKGR